MYLILQMLRHAELSLLVILIWKIVVSAIEYMDPILQNMHQQHVFISKVEPLYINMSEKLFTSYCYNTTDGGYSEVDCRCHGKELKDIPVDLDKTVRRITVTNSNMQFIPRDSFQPYKDTLWDM